MRRRNMYYATALPGWMRSGYRPGWAGRSAGGMGPCAQYLMTGQWPAPAAAIPPATYDDRAQRLAMLQAQATVLEQQLQAIHQELADIEQS